MSAEHDLIVRIEDMTRRAWPPAHLDRINGWELRATNGYTRRANSANPYPQDPADLEAAVGRVESWYRARSLRPIFRMTRVSNPPGLEELLSERGYGIDPGTHVMTAPTVPGHAIDVSDAPTAEWIAAKDRWSPLSPDHRAAWLSLLARTRARTGYALLRSGTDVVAAGHAVAEGDLVALFGLVVDPTQRRRSHGEQLSRGLMTWGHEQGASTVWLQVHTPSNRGAVSLYRKLGFTTLYDYWYLEAPVGGDG